MKRLLLVGGGQAHAFVLRALAAQRRRDVEVVLVTPSDRLVYSGMLPGWIAGHYTLPELTIPLPPLAEAAGAIFVQRRVVGLDPEHRTIRTDRDELIEFDLLSIASGPAVDFDAIPGSRDFALPIRPLDNFVEGWARIHSHALTTDTPLRLTVIGAGAGGVEVALAMKYRLGVCRDRVRVQLVTGSGSLLAGHGARARTLLKDALLRQGVRLVEGVVRQIERDSAQLEDGGVLPSDATLLVTGAAAEAWPAASGLATDERGFIAVTPNLQSASHPFVFAAGDAATFVDAPRAKSGVYAVRAGPPLAANLIATLDGRPLTPFRPQRRALYLITTGPRHAVASWGQLAVSGAAVWQWKDRIDRAYVAKFRMA
ncbi:MAG: FAD-dependent oxidoreductase [Betaproteobacteria bacterium]